MQHVPSHEHGVACRPRVLLAAALGVRVCMYRYSLPVPIGVGLWGDGEPDVLQRVQDLRAGVLAAILVAGTQRRADLPVVGPLPNGVELTRIGIEPLDGRAGLRTPIASRPPVWLGSGERFSVPLK